LLALKLTLKGQALSPRYFVKNDLIFRPIGAFFISTLVLKVIHAHFLTISVLPEESVVLSNKQFLQAVHEGQSMSASALFRTKELIIACDTLGSLIWILPMLYA